MVGDVFGGSVESRGLAGDLVTEPSNQHQPSYLWDIIPNLVRSNSIAPKSYYDIILCLRSISFSEDV